MSSQLQALPGLARSEPQLLEAAEHHFAHAQIALAELIEAAEENDHTKLDGRELSDAHACAWALLCDVRRMKKGVSHE